MKNMYICVPWVERPINPEWSKTFKKHGTKLNFPKNTLILNDGDVVTKAYYVDKGMAMYMLNSYGGSARIAGILPPGRAFGLGPIFHKEPIILSVKTIEDSIIYCLPHDKVLQAIQKDTSLAVDVINNISHKLRSVMSALSLISTCSAEERLAYYFYTLIFYNGTNKNVINAWEELQINLSHEQIGEIIGTNRVTVCRLFNKFKKQNKLKQVGGKIYINTHWLHMYSNKLCNTESFLNFSNR